MFIIKRKKYKTQETGYLGSNGLKQAVVLIDAISDRFDIPSDMATLNKILKQMEVFSRAYMLYYDIDWVDSDTDTVYVSEAEDAWTDFLNLLGYEP